MAIARVMLKLMSSAVGWGWGSTKHMWAWLRKTTGHGGKFRVTLELVDTQMP